MATKINEHEIAYDWFLNSLRRCFDHEGMTVTEIAHESGLTRSFVSCVKSRKKSASFNAQVKIANACGYQYIDFLASGKSSDAESVRFVPADDAEQEAAFELLKSIPDKDTLYRLIQLIHDINQLAPDRYYQRYGDLAGEVAKLRQGEKSSRELNGPQRKVGNG